MTTGTVHGVLQGGGPAATAMTAGTEPRWTDVCALDALLPERGVAALVGGVQVALFRTYDDTVYAVSNRDPFSGAHVLSRGIVGTRGDAPTVASPMHKQVFDLRTGACLDDPGAVVDVFPVRVRDGRVEIRPGLPGTATS